MVHSRSRFHRRHPWPRTDKDRAIASRRASHDRRTRASSRATVLAVAGWRGRVSDVGLEEDVGNKRRARKKPSARREQDSLTASCAYSRCGSSAYRRFSRAAPQPQYILESRASLRHPLVCALLTLYSSSKDCNNLSVSSVQYLCIGGPLPQRELPVLAAAAGLSVRNPRVARCRLSTTRVTWWCSLFFQRRPPAVFFSFSFKKIY